MAKFLPTKGQAETVGVLADILYKGVALFVVLALLIVGFGTFIYAIFNLDKPAPTTILGGIDLLLGFLLKQVYGSLFQVRHSIPKTE